MPRPVSRQRLFLGFEEKKADQRAENDEWNVSRDAPLKHATVGDPAVLGKEAQDYPDRRKEPDGELQSWTVLFLEAFQPDIVQHKVEKGHRDRRDQFSDAEGGGEVRAGKVVQHARNKMKGVPDAQSQGGGAGQFFRSVFRFDQKNAPAEDGKQQIKDVER